MADTDHSPLIRRRVARCRFPPPSGSPSFHPHSHYASWSKWGDALPPAYLSSFLPTISAILIPHENRARSRPPIRVWVYTLSLPLPPLPLFLSRAPAPQLPARNRSCTSCDSQPVNERLISFGTANFVGSNATERNRRVKRLLAASQARLFSFMHVPAGGIPRAIGHTFDSALRFSSRFSALRTNRGRFKQRQLKRAAERSPAERWRPAELGGLLLIFIVCSAIVSRTPTTFPRLRSRAVNSRTLFHRLCENKRCCFARLRHRQFRTISL